MDDDFNTPGAIAALFDLTREVNSLLASAQPPNAAELEAIDALYRRLLGDVLGILPEKLEEEAGSGLATGLIDLLVETRTKLRQAKQWALSDEIRDRLTALGVQLRDGRMHDWTLRRWTRRAAKRNAPQTGARRSEIPETRINPWMAWRPGRGSGWAQPRLRGAASGPPPHPEGAAGRRGRRERARCEQIVRLCQRQGIALVLRATARPGSRWAVGLEHQGVAAEVSAYPYVELDDLLRRISTAAGRSVPAGPRFAPGSTERGLAVAHRRGRGRPRRHRCRSGAPSGSPQPSAAPRRAPWSTCAICMVTNLARTHGGTQDERHLGGGRGGTPYRPRLSRGGPRACPWPW